MTRYSHVYCSPKTAAWRLGFGFSNGKPGQSRREAVTTARLGLAYLGSAWLGLRPQAGPCTALAIMRGPCSGKHNSKINSYNNYMRESCWAVYWQNYGGMERFREWRWRQISAIFRSMKNDNFHGLTVGSWPAGSYLIEPFRTPKGSVRTGWELRGHFKGVTLVTKDLEKIRENLKRAFV